MFDIPMRNMSHNELVTLSLGSRNKNVILKGKKAKRNPVVKDLNDTVQSLFLAS